MKRGRGGRRTALLSRVFTGIRDGIVACSDADAVVNKGAINLGANEECPISSSKAFAALAANTPDKINLGP